MRGSLPLELHVLIRRRKRPARDEPEPGLRDAGALRVDEAQLPERRKDRLVVDELLNAMERCLAALSVQVDRLLAEQSVDVGIASVDVRPARNDEVLETARGVAERAAQTIDEIFQLLLLVALEERRPLERTDLHADARRLEI